MTEKLIELVRRESVLYDTSHPDYSKKTLKEMIWTRISSKANYKDGPSAKDAWLKLRNCHRDAIRRKGKLSKSGSATNVWKTWRFEKQMEFLMTHMSNKRTTGNMLTGTSSQEGMNRTENLIDDKIFSGMEKGNGTENNNTITTFVHRPQVSLDEISPGISISNNPSTPEASSEVGIPGTSIVNTSGSTRLLLKNLLRIANTLKRHEEKAKQRASKRCLSHDNDDDLQQFFNTMYTITKKMPALSQCQLKRKMFNLVASEEENLINLSSLQDHSIENTPVNTSINPISIKKDCMNEFEPSQYTE